jgi:hypothetical protein
MKINPLLATLSAASLAVWLLVSAAAGGGEAWDAGAYWSIGLPVIYALGGAAGYVSRLDVSRLALWSGAGQFVGLFLTAADMSLWPLGLVMLGVLSLPVAGAARLARLLRDRAPHGR